MIPKSADAPLLLINIEKMEVTWQDKWLYNYVRSYIIIENKMVSSSNETVLNYTYKKIWKKDKSTIGFFCFLGCIGILLDSLIGPNNVSSVANKYLKEYAQELQSKIPAASALLTHVTQKQFDLMLSSSSLK